MPENSGYNMGAIDRMVQLAVDPIYDAPTPADSGVLSRGVFQHGDAAPSLGYQQRPSYAMGGVVRQPGAVPQGGPGLAPQGQTSAPIPPARMEQEIQRMVQQNPQIVMQIKQAFEQAVASGELTPEELNMAVQLATAAAQNPQLWPQIVKFAEQQGLADPGMLPQQYDQGLVFVILLAAKTVQQQGAPVPGQPQGVPQAEGQPPVASFKGGGAIPDSRNSDGSVAINAHEGEFVIPKDVATWYGTKHLTKMISDFKEQGSGTK